jgi:hypothetical protein
VGEPEGIEYWAEGRRANRAEIDESIRTGLPLLEAEAEKQEGGMAEGGTGASGGGSSGIAAGRLKYGVNK